MELEIRSEGVYFMTKEEYKQLVEYAVGPKAAIRYPLQLIENFDRWQNRATLAMVLQRNDFPDLQPILELLYSAVDGEVADGDEHINLDIKELTYRALAWCIWKVENDVDKALQYIDRGIAQTESRGGEALLTQGEFWDWRWRYLEASERLAQALTETEKIIAAEDAASQNNSLLYYAYHFKAETAKRSNIEESLSYLYKALRYFPDEHNELPKREELWEQRQSAPEKTYEELEKLTHHEVVWER